MTGHDTAPGEQSPVVTAIHIAPASRLSMRAVESVQVEAGLGIVGDRYHGTKHRHVTVQSQTALDAATEDLASPVEPGGTRRNITISHGDVPTSRGERIRIGDVALEVVRAAAPCKLLDDVIGTGTRTALSGRAGSVFGPSLQGASQSAIRYASRPAQGRRPSTRPSMATVGLCVGSMISRCPTATWSHRRSSRGR